MDPKSVRFGPFEVDFNKRVLWKHGVRVRLQAQPFQVLAALLETPGAPITRDELRRRVWPDDNFVDFEHGLNAAVTRLRQALGDSAENPRYIQTLPKYGYRFCGNIEPSPAAVEPEPSPAGPEPRRRTVALWVPIVILAAGGCTFLFWRTVGRADLPEMRTAPLTAFPGYEAHPAISPDGDSVAFIWDGEKRDNLDIYVMRIGSDAPVRLTTDPARDIRPAWSPDGRRIAFLRRSTGDRAELIVIPPAGGLEHRVGEIRSMELRMPVGRFTSLAWTPDGRWIAASHRGPKDVSERIYLFSPAGESRPLTQASPLAADQMPAFSPDGSTLAVSRLTGYSTSAIYVLPLDSNYNQAGEARAITQGKAMAVNPVWVADGRLLYLTGNDAWHFEAAVASVASARASQPVEPFQLQIQGAAELAVRGRRLVYSRVQRDINIWRARIPHAGENPSTPERLIYSTWMDGQPSYSPDGKKIAFQSARSGSLEVWVSKTDGSNPVRITNFGGPIIGFPNWSADGRSIVFHARPEGQADLFVVSAAGGTPKRLTTDPADDASPSYSHDGRWIYFESSRSGQPQICKMPAAGGQAVQLTTSGGYRPEESLDGKMVFYYSVDNTAIWSVPVNGGAPAKVVDVTHDYPSGFAVAKEGIYYTLEARSGEQRSIRLFRFSTGRSTPVVLAGRPFAFGMAVSTDSKYIVFDQREEVSSDLMMIDNFSLR